MLNITMSEARQRNFLLGLSDPEQEKRSQSALAYVDILAQQVKANVSAWPLSVFANESGTIEKDRGKLNRKFFLYLETVGREATKTMLTREQIETIKASIVDSLGDDIRHHEDVIRGMQNDIRSHYRVIEEKQARLVASARAIEALKSGSDYETRIIESIQAAFDDGFFKFRGVSSGFLEFITAPITIKYIDPAAKIDLSCYMGSYLVRIKIKNLNVTVLGYAENSKPGSYYHPHVDSDGRLCWGSIDVSKEKLNKDYAGLLKAIRFLLTTYNDSSAYKIIDEFARCPKLYNSTTYIIDNPGAPYEIERPRVFDAEGFDTLGYDKEGYDREGYDRDGYDSEGYDHDGYDSEGYDHDGLNRYGDPRPSDDDDYEGDR